MAKQEAVSQAEVGAAKVIAEKSSPAASPADAAGSSRSSRKDGSVDRREAAAPKTKGKPAGAPAAAGANGRPARTDKEEPAGKIPLQVL